ncbi:6-phosphogluconolactonase [Actinoplanes teichomyceticus]|uniref:6-phosphogluconolactonase n=1 Tax=Actinoplanes teichomyceticus TaxID=1867 RepID=A0A561WKN5_ACTTI|nr:6-phosphogluconolactonase [Actinoplanes teichomyceticus]TWG24436.1 6-phosphogluconolactonase [Actinoplanes teichomyceticus]GIF12713.1 hypothetical protein Ate01nite_27450 [Actinoplanes teichomyceticus]
MPELAQHQDLVVTRAAGFADLAEQVSARVVEHIDRVLRQHEFCTVALTGGSTPAATYRSLSAADLPWDRIHVLQTDDHIVADSETGPSWSVIERDLLHRCAVPVANRHPMPVRTGPGLASAVRRYDMQIRSLLRGQSPDVVVLGLGEDGHTASIFDGDPSALTADRVVVTTAPYHGVTRMTLTLPTLARGGLRVVLACGTAKAAAVAGLLGEGAPRTSAVAGILRGGGMLFVDDAAMSVADAATG